MSAKDRATQNLFAENRLVLIAFAGSTISDLKLHRLQRGSEVRRCWECRNSK